MEIVVRDRWESFLEKTRTIWEFPLLSLSDGQTITVGTLASGIILLVLGILFSRLITARIGRLAQRRFRMEERVAASVQSLLF